MSFPKNILSQARFILSYQINKYKMRVFINMYIYWSYTTDGSTAITITIKTSTLTSSTSQSIASRYKRTFIWYTKICELKNIKNTGFGIFKVIITNNYSTALRTKTWFILELIQFNIHMYWAISLTLIGHMYGLNIEYKSPINLNQNKRYISN